MGLRNDGDRETVVSSETIVERISNNDEDDIWALSEGYTPLQDGILQSDTGFLVATSNATTFAVSDASVFFQTAHEDDDAEEEEEQEDSDHPVSLQDTSLVMNPDRSNDPSPPISPTNNPNDYNEYQTIADQALKMLECDYHNTLQNNTMEKTRGSAELTTTPEPNQHSILQDHEERQGNAPQSLFYADFDQLSNSEVDQPTPTTTTTTHRSQIDSDAILRAVQSIRSKDPTLTMKLEAWDQQHQQRRQRTLPSIHPIVPSAPLAAFHKSTAKAVQATARLSRSATLAEALRRLDILRGSSQDLRIHVVGCDAVECDALDATFGPIVRWLGNYVECPGTVHFDVIGPNVPSRLCDIVYNLIPETSSTRMRSATLQCHSCLYHELAMTAKEESIDLIVAFNAGIWGYDDWIPCLDFIVSQQQTIPFVATAYTIEEAEDDLDVIQAQVSTKGIDPLERLQWPVEANPFGSHVPRETATAVAGREYRENAAWQAWRL